MANEFQNKYTEPALKQITEISDAPITKPAVRRYPDAAEWTSAHGKEIYLLYRQNEITWMQPAYLPAQ